MVESSGTDLAMIAEEIGKGKIRAVLDPNASFTGGLKDVPAAVAYQAKGHAKGKVTVSNIGKDSPA